MSGVEFSTDDEPESVSDRPSSAQNSKENGQTSTQRPPKKKREMIIQGESSKQKRPKFNLFDSFFSLSDF